MLSMIVVIACFIVAAICFFKLVLAGHVFGGLFAAFIIVGFAAWFSNNELKKQHQKNVEKFGQETADMIRKIAMDRANGIKEESDAPWGIHYFQDPCPYCGKKAVRLAKWEDKRASVAFWGAASSKLGAQYKCDACKKMWE